MPTSSAPLPRLSVRAWYSCLVLCTVLAGLTGCQRSDSSGSAPTTATPASAVLTAIDRQAFAFFAEAYGVPIVSAKGSKAPELVEGLYLSKNVEVARATLTDPHLQEVRAAHFQIEQEIHAAATELENLGLPASSVWTFLEMGIYASASRLDAALDTYKADERHRTRLQAAGRRLVEACRQSEALRSLLFIQAPRFASPQPLQKINVSLDYFTRFGDDLDSLELHYSGTGQLTNVTLQVGLRSRAGQTVVNYHFVESWAPEERLTATYPKGLTWGGITLDRRTLEDIAAIDLTVYSDQGTFQTRRTYTPSERQASLESYLEVLRRHVVTTVRASNRPAWLSDGEAGSVLQIRNRHDRPLYDLRVRIVRGDKVVGDYRQPVLAAGEVQEIGYLEVGRSLYSGDVVHLSLGPNALKSIRFE